MVLFLLFPCLTGRDDNDENFCVLLTTGGGLLRLNQTDIWKSIATIYISQTGKYSEGQLYNRHVNTAL